MKRFYIAADAGCLLLAAAILIATALLLWPHTAAKTVPTVEATVAAEPYDPRPDQLDIYFDSKGMPLAGYGIHFVKAADSAGIDYALLAAISVKESTGGKRYPKATNNPFGYGSAKISFPDIATAIYDISNKLGCKTKTSYCRAKGDSWGIANIYNPPTVEPGYADRVMKIIKDIKATEVPADYNLPIKQK